MTKEQYTKSKDQKFVFEKPDGYIVKVTMGFLAERVIKIGNVKYEFSMIPLHAKKTEQEAKTLYDAFGEAKLK